MLHIENLAVNYGYVQALRGISLDVNEKEIVTLIGSNGAGKSTTLMSISGLAPKAEGTITFEGTDITRLQPEKISRLGIAHIPEGRHIFPALTVYENLITGTIANKKLKKDRISELLEQQYQLFPRLKERLNQAGGSLSGVEQQMLAVGRALMQDPKLLMMDEPSLGLAPLLIEEVFRAIKKIKEDGLPILLVEQNSKAALQVADRGYVLEVGELVLEDTAENLLHNEAIKKSYLGMG